MPNMFGGDSHHPAYSSRFALGPNEELVGSTVYRARPDGTVIGETVDGREFRARQDEIPAKLLDYINSKRRAWAAPVVTEI